MGARRRLIVALLVLGAACKRKEPPAPGPAPSASVPSDRLAAGEIPEGREKAFTLSLPLHSTVKARFPDSIHVASQHTPEELTKFIAARVKDGTRSSSATETRFDKVVATKDATKTLVIEIRSAPAMTDYKSQIVVKDITPAPEQPGTTDADRWKKAGMTPDGKLLNPKQMQ